MFDINNIKLLIIKILIIIIINIYYKDSNFVKFCIADGITSILQWRKDLFWVLYIIILLLKLN